jgi:23S rRNA (cytosine1962-C5)-methyltransferase
MISEWLLSQTECQSVYEKSQRGGDKIFSFLGGCIGEPLVQMQENGALFRVDLEKGQKTGFFLDQRDNRNYLKLVVGNKTVLNLFSYTGGFSIYAGLGHAQKVASLDVSKGAIQGSEENWALNGLDPSLHEGICVDVFDYLNVSKELWDHVVVDPPSMSHSEEQKETAILKYTELFAKAAKRVKVGGELSLSSCSSHISFEDFFTIIDEALSQARRRGQIYRVSGQGFDHPFPHACHELRYLKFVHLGLD